MGEKDPLISQDIDKFLDLLKEFWKLNKLCRNHKSFVADIWKSQPQIKAQITQTLNFVWYAGERLVHILIFPSTAWHSF